MTIELFAHPFSSYCQKALIAFHENDITFTYRMMEDLGVGEEFAALWPLKRFPILREDGRVVMEATSVIEYLQVHHPGPVKLIPEDPDLAVEVRMLDTSYAWLDERMRDRIWAVGDSFSLADCAAAPSLFYADWTQRIPERYAHLKAYRARLLHRPSFARAVEEARGFRHYFPLGAPDRD